MQKLEWSTVQRKVNDLLPLDINPRKITDEKRNKLIESINKFNLAEIPTINKDNTLISGHQRMKAMQIIGRGDELIDVRIPNRQLSLKELKEYNIISNTHAGEFDFDLLDTHFGDIDFEDLGISFDDIRPIEDAPKKLEAVEDDFEIPDKIETNIVLGDLFEIGPHRLLCGDSTQTDTFKKLFEDKLADLVITDPPYNVDYTGGTKDALKIENDKMTNSSFYKFLYDFYTALGSYTKQGGAWYVWHADSEGANFRLAMVNAGIMFKQCLIWVKNSLVMGRQDYHWKHEPCLYGWKPGAAHSWHTDRKQTTVLNFDRPIRNAEHPTMKPIPLIGYQIKNSSKLGDIVADGFGGSGTTMVSSHQLERICYMVEFSPNYCQVIINRMIKLDPSLKIKRNGIEWNIQTNS
jgi:DNA modification methylase